jgi:hypothetical protein
VPIFGVIAETLKGVSKVQKMIVAKIGGNQEPPREGGFVSLGAIPKKARPMHSDHLVTTTPQESRAAGAGAGTGARLGSSQSVNNTVRCDTAAKGGKGNSNVGKQNAGPGPVTNKGKQNLSVPVIDLASRDREFFYDDEDECTVEEKRFKEAIREAEKSTLIFNLDMGRVPVMNKETMSKRASLALANMAANKEKKNGPVPSADTVESLDDVLSLVNNMEFYGEQTKTYRHPTDKKSGLFCTVPVRYDFKDKDTRFRAEAILRSSCGVQCATPYPVMVKECIRQIVNRVKGSFPDHFVKVTVDTRDMTFKVARKPPKNDPDPGWKYRIGDIPIPNICLDLNMRRVPRDFILPIPVKENEDEPTPYRNTRRPVSGLGEGRGNGNEAQNEKTPPKSPWVSTQNEGDDKNSTEAESNMDLGEEGGGAPLNDE